MYEVTVVFRDDTTGIYHCDDYGHSPAGEAWLILTNANEPYVMLSQYNVKSVSFTKPSDFIN